MIDTIDSHFTSEILRASIYDSNFSKAILDTQDAASFTKIQLHQGKTRAPHKPS